ncbi:MAG TPA: GNAT family N-acetyltransferase [Usitatibacter sp.]|nr:GNAT family N-acetyltransferase [Usitatibacter sp.]
MGAALDPWRLEELSLNSSAPPGQLLYDGWLLRFLPGKAKRARSVNAVYPSRLALDEKIARCERAYGAARLPLLFRITPFCQPPGLDEDLARRGYGRFDTTAVESARIDPCLERDGDAQPMNLAAWIEAVGELRGSPVEHRASHRARLESVGLTLRAVAVQEAGRVVATGLAMIEDDSVGLFDIVTREDARRRGHARAVVAGLLRTAWELGARNAYLQVSGDNEGARRLYRQFGFEERYLYWYRGRPGEQR